VTVSFHSCIICFYSTENYENTVHRNNCVFLWIPCITQKLSCDQKTTWIHLLPDRSVLCKTMAINLNQNQWRELFL
jgi:hypothetical protein